MDIRDKLKYYQASAKKTEPEKQHRYRYIAESLGGDILEQDTLPVIRIEKFYDYSHFYLTEEETQLQSIYIPLLTKNRFPEKILLNKVLIFDLETTGLAGGTGTYPFLIGFGVFEDQGIRLSQYFLPDFGREINAFLDMRNILNNKNVLLTYNGKSFDYPLLRNRMIMNRMDDPFNTFFHLDLLHLARRLWKGSLPSCSLSTIEEKIFLFNRFHDIDGALIPQAYFTYLQTGDLSEIRRIIEHNQQDLISLSRLLFHMHHIENMHLFDTQTNVELYSMLKIAVGISDMKRTRQILDKFKANHKKIPADALKKYSLLLKRQNQWDEALSLWHDFLNRGEEIIFATEELAKYFEHKKNSVQDALDYTMRALKYIELIQEISDKDKGLEETRNRFTHRRLRLIQKSKIIKG